MTTSNQTKKWTKGLNIPAKDRYKYRQSIDTLAYSPFLAFNFKPMPQQNITSHSIGWSLLTKWEILRLTKILRNREVLCFAGGIKCCC